MPAGLHDLQPFLDDYNYIYTKVRKTYTLKAGEDTAKGILISSSGGL